MRLDVRQVALVAAREYLENVRTRGFWLSVLVLPVILVAASTIPLWLTRAEGPAAFAVVDASGWTAAAVRERIRMDDVAAVVAALRTAEPGTLPAALEDVRATLDTRDPAPALAAFWQQDPDAVVTIAPNVSFARFREIDAAGLDRAELNRRLDADTLAGYFVLPEDPVADDAGATFVSRKLTNPELRLWYERYATDVVRDRRIREENIDAATARWMQAPVRFAPIHRTEAGAEAVARTEDMLAQWAPVAFVYVLWISIFAVTQMLLTNTVEEKSNRLVEVLLSSLSADDLMAGKIVGIAATGLTIVATWVAILLALVYGLPRWLDSPVPFDLAALVDDPLYLGSFVVYFILGYLFYAAVLCAIGSVANNLKEAQNLMMPVQICLVVPLLVMIPIGRDPDGWLAAVLSWFPPFTPFVMMNRAAFPPGWLTYVGTTLLMLVSIRIALSLAARVFAHGILRTGKAPRLAELLHLVRRP
jgi:ABC-2 type transport system permease protein